MAVRRGRRVVRAGRRLSGAAGVLAVVVAFTGVPGAGAASSQTAADTSLVTVVHGLRGELVDVSLDGKLLLPAFQPDRLTDPTPVPAGSHTVSLRPAGTPASGEPKLEQTVEVPAGRSLSLVAYYSADDTWALTAFANDLSPTGSEGRVVFRNTAAVSSIDVEVDGATAAAALAQGAESQRDLPAGSHAVAVNAPGATTPLLPATDVDVGEGSANFLYLVGQGTDVTWLMQRVDGLQLPPALVSSGESGLLTPARPDDISASESWVLGIGLGTTILAGCVGMLALRRRSPMP